MPSAASLANLRPPWQAGDASQVLGTIAAKQASANRPPPIKAPRVRRTPADKFQAGHLKQVRAILRKLRSRLFIQSDTLIDPKPLEQLARSIAVLSEVERKLAGRPDPGHYKPKTPEPQQAPRTRPLLSLPEPPKESITPA